jgi:hypothetical protein
LTRHHDYRAGGKQQTDRSLAEQPGIEKGSDMSDAVSPALYVIQSKIGNSDWVLTVTNDNGYVHLDHNAVDQRQLWVREDDAARGGFFCATRSSTAVCAPALRKAGG